MGDGSAFGILNSDPQTEELIDKILHGTTDGRVDPDISADLRLKLAQYPGERDRAVLEHLRTQSRLMGFELDAVLARDLEPDDDPAD